jgi:4-amino-4-deoxy-L-arabinose transferase-like glycosyltransferase
MNFIQTTLQVIEVGKGQILVRIVPLAAAVLIAGLCYNFGPIQTPIGPVGGIYHGLNDAQSMDNAQLARQLVRHQGFTTEFLRPQALAQLRDFATTQSLSGASSNLFPPDRFTTGVPKIVPDTYNAPAYPILLAAFFYFTHPEFDQVATDMAGGHTYSGDRWIPLLNQGLMLLTALLVFALGQRLFDDRVAWLAIIAFLGTDLIWHYTLTALSTSFLMFLITGGLMCVLEIFCVGEACFANEDRSFGPAWWWGLATAIIFGIACLTRLHLLVLLLPLFLFLLIMPRGSFLLYAAIALVVVGMTAPWFLHENKISGNPLGSNFTQVLYGQGDYLGNRLYCTTSIPNYEHLFGFALKKEITGFRWHFEHAWNLLGANPLIMLFGASIFHQFKRRRTRLFHWLLYSCAVAIVVANNLGVAEPEALGPWNTLVILFPCMIVIGAAYFFILIDRLNIQMRLLQNMVVTTTVVFILLPLWVTLTTPSNSYYAFPPYMPPLIKSLAQYAQTDEWVTSDMPWATAWYGDRASLWLPDSIADFQNFYDNVCPTGIIILTPVTWASPISNYTGSGEYKDWYTFAVGLPAPTTFPLTVHTVTAPGGPDYSVWSDRPRWQQEQH